MAESITTALSRIRWVSVVARSSTLAYRGVTIDVRRAGRELGARYILEGGVYKAGSRIRVNARLIEVESGMLLWADKYEGGLPDVFEFQDNIADRVIGIVEPSLQRSEI